MLHDISYIDHVSVRLNLCCLTVTLCSAVCSDVKTDKLAVNVETLTKEAMLLETGYGRIEAVALKRLFCCVTGDY